MYNPVSNLEETPKNNTSSGLESAFQNGRPVFGSEFPRSRDAKTSVQKDEAEEHPSMQEEAMRSGIMHTNLDTEDMGYYKPSYSPPEDRNEDLAQHSARSKGSLANSTILSHSYVLSRFSPLNFPRNIEKNEELLRPNFIGHNLPSLLYKKGEELRQHNTSSDYDNIRLDLKEMPSASKIRTDEFEVNTLLDDSSRRRGNEDFKASTCNLMIVMSFNSFSCKTRFIIKTCDNQFTI